jgi:succinate dehydrogenase / fumarate reductase cytochrome b subunit
MRDTRPKNLNLFTIRFPLPAIVSGLHRISGVLLFILVPFLLWALSFSLTSRGFDVMGEWLSNVYVKCVLWLFLIPFIFHLIAGIRHLLSDIHIGDTLQGGRRGALLTMLFSFVFIILAGVWLW